MKSNLKHVVMATLAATLAASALADWPSEGVLVAQARSGDRVHALPDVADRARDRIHATDTADRVQDRTRDMDRVPDRDLTRDMDRVRDQDMDRTQDRDRVHQLDADDDQLPAGQPEQLRTQEQEKLLVEDQNRTRDCELGTDCTQDQERAQEQERDRERAE